jgi:thioredoxin reductase (NADPH)
MGIPDADDYYDPPEVAMHDLIVIGGGPAGLSAAAYALSKRLNVLLLCAKLGGKASEHQQFAGQRGHENLVGEEAVMALKRQITAHPDRIRTDLVISVFKRDGVFHVLTEHATLHTHAVMLATGTQPMLLGIPNEVQLVGRGLGYSITTHAHLAAGRDVAVVGATTRSLRGVAELLQIAHGVVLIAPYPGELGSTLGQRLREHPNVHLLEGYQITEVEAQEGAVCAIIVARGSVASRIPVQVVFVDLGMVPSVQMVRQLVQLDEQGFIVVDDQNRTSVRGLFAAGDVTTAGGEQMLIAVGEGARAALSAYDYVLAQRLRMNMDTLPSARQALSRPRRGNELV